MEITVDVLGRKVAGECYSICSMYMLPGILPVSSLIGRLAVSAESDCSGSRRRASSRRLTMALKCMERGVGVVFGRGREARSTLDASGTGFRRRFMRWRKRRSMIIVGVRWCEYFWSSLSPWSISRAGVGGGDRAGGDGIALESGSDTEAECSEISNEMVVRRIWRQRMRVSSNTRCNLDGRYPVPV